MHIILLVVALVLNATANLMIKAGVRTLPQQVPLIETLKAAVANPWWLIGGVLCFGLNLAAYGYALHKLPVSWAYPIMVSVSYAIIVCGAAVWFNERLTPRQMVGVAVILAGVWIVASGIVETA